jgi:hypothetical protein
MIIAVRGYERPGGEFEVRDLCLPAMAPQPPLPAGGALILLLRVAFLSPACRFHASDYRECATLTHRVFCASLLPLVFSNPNL